MTSKEHLINQHILQYEARLKHIDELLSHAQAAAAASELHSDHEQELKELESKRDELSNFVNLAKTMSVEHWEKDELDLAGPMGVWDVVAQKIEKIIEHKK